MAIIRKEARIILTKEDAEEFDNNIIGIPKWVNCNNCSNFDTVFCMSCKVKYETAPYLNYSVNTVTVTDTTSIS